MDTQTATRTRLCRSYEDFIQELRKESDFEVNGPVHYGRHAKPLMQAAVWDDGTDGNKKSFASTWLYKDCNQHEAKSHNRKYYRYNEVKDLLLLGFFCVCLLAVNLACWSFFAGVPAGR